VVITPLKEREPVLESRLASTDVTVGGVSAVIKPGMRAVAVKGDKVIGISGFIQPGNRVDVLVTMKDPTTKNEITKMVLSNVLVLATGTEIEDSRDGKPRPVDVYTLEVDPEQAERLGLAAAEGKLQFALRNMTDQETVLTKGRHGRPDPSFPERDGRDPAATHGKGVEHAGKKEFHKVEVRPSKGTRLAVRSSTFRISILKLQHRESPRAKLPETTHNFLRRNVIMYQSNERKNRFAVGAPQALIVLLVVFLSWAVGSPPAGAQEMGKLSVVAGKSIILKSVEQVKRVSIADPAIANFVLTSPTEIYITGRAPGVTNMTLWMDKGIYRIYDLEVGYDVSRLKQQLNEILPDEKDLR
jgi:Flp pilus assembly protein CpaB